MPENAFSQQAQIDRAGILDDQGVSVRAPKVTHESQKLRATRTETETDDIDRLGRPFRERIEMVIAGEQQIDVMAEFGEGITEPNQIQAGATKAGARPMCDLAEQGDPPLARCRSGVVVH